MNSLFNTFAALFLLFAAASCAPTGATLQGACAGVQGSSLALNRIAKIVSVEARNGSKDMTNFIPTLSWMEEKDMCDPESLKKNSEPCVGKILDVLTGYISAAKTIAGFESCSAFISRVKPAMDTLHEDMSTCVVSKTGINPEKAASHVDTLTIARWKEDLMCHYILDRLFSFSILTARVFALGDPARHSDSSAQKCM